MSENEAPATAAVLKERWALIVALGSFAIYLLGYLTLRFQLTALGLASDLQLVDERYLFAGGRFLVYLVATIPLTLILLAPVLLIGWGLLRFGAVKRWWSRILADQGHWLAGISIVASVVLIQLVLRKCFLFENLLLLDELPGPDWFAAMFTASTDQAQWFFALVLVGIIVNAAAINASRWWEHDAPWQRSAGALSCVLLGIQILLLPVNYGYLMAARPLPRLATENRQWLLANSSDTVWLVWEGDRGITLLSASTNGRRKLITVARDKATQIEIAGYDSFTQVRKRAANTPAPHPELEERSTASNWSWEQLAELAGFTATPRMQRIEDTGRVRGDIFVISSQPQGGETAFRLTTTGDYHSPLFQQEKPSNLFALRDGLLVELDTDAVEPPKEIARLADAQRLLAIHPTKPQTILFLADPGDGPQIHSYDVLTGAVTDLVQNSPAGDASKAMAHYAMGEYREYGQLRLKVEDQSDDVRSWKDVFIQRVANQSYENLTEGNGKSSRQPALSRNGGLVAFVREGE